MRKKVFMNFNGKHLSLEDRKIIEQTICKGLRKFETAKELNKSQSTIGKEIKKYRKCKYSLADTPPWNCKFFKDCMVCTSKCIHFEETPCNRRDRFVGACNCCPNIKKCRKTKYFYYANVAQKNYEYTLKDSREGVNLNTTELYELAHIICPLIKQGQSIYTILQNHKEITQCEKTIYTYIEMGLFKDWGVTNLDLRRKVTRKLKKKKLKKEQNLLTILEESMKIIWNLLKTILALQQLKWILYTIIKKDHIFKLLSLKIQGL